MTKNRIFAIDMTHFDSADMVGTFLPINSLGLDEACFIIRITNDTSADVIVSFDGVTDNDYVRYGETLQLYAVPSDDRTNFAKGLVVYLRGAANQGYIYLSGYYKLPGL